MTKVDSAAPKDAPVRVYADGEGWALLICGNGEGGFDGGGSLREGSEEAWLGCGWVGRMWLNSECGFWVGICVGMVHQGEMQGFGKWGSPAGQMAGAGGHVFKFVEGM